ncbi:MAG: hypothetical protein LQ349_008741, partial [Xanthoria aureola]
MPERQLQTTKTPTQPTAIMVAETKDKDALALEKLARDTKLAARRPNMEISVPKAASMMKATKDFKKKPRNQKAREDYYDAVIGSSVQKNQVDRKKLKETQKQREERLGPVKTGEAKSQAFQKWLDESMAQSNAWAAQHHAKYR